MKIGIIGLGRMGFVQARLARLFGDELLWGCDNAVLACEEFHREFNVPIYTNLEEIDYSKCEVIWITVNDDNIERCAKAISKRVAPGTTIFHTSGVRDSRILKAHLPQQSCASFHPLMACPMKTCNDRECADTYYGIVHTVEGDISAINVAKSIIERIGAKFVQINASDKILYHAAAVFASNYPLTLMDIAVQLFKKCGFDEESASSACKLMMGQILKSLQNNSIADALTGPVKRKDQTTIEQHQTALNNFPEYLQLYNLLKDETEKLLHR